MTTKTYSRNLQSKRDHLILDNLDYVARILSTMSVHVANDQERENLHSAGLVGLVEAANSFDPTKGATFKTHAYRRIQGAILDELRNQTPVSPAVFKKIAVVRKAYEASEPPVTPESLAEKTELTIDQVVDCLEAMRFINPDGWSDFADMTHVDWHHHATSPDYELELEEKRMQLAQAIEKLPDNERLVLTLYHLEELKLAEIAAAMDLSVSRISKIHAAAVFRARELIRCQTM